MKRSSSKKFSFSQSVIFDNENYFAINKPSSYTVLDDRKYKNRDSILEMARDIYPDCQVCHRIDRDTSGILVFAKNASAYRNLSIQFEEREVAKMYHALCHGKHLFKEELIEAPLLYNNGVSKVSDEGKHSATILETVSVNGNFSLIECMPLTGRTHQIRVHLMSVGAPIVADTQYGGQKLYLSDFKKKFNVPKGKEELPLMERSALHAFKIRFRDLNEELIQIEAPYQKDMLVALKQLLKHT